LDDVEASAAPSQRTRRRISGDLAEQAVARHLAALGWTILGRNVRVGRSEVDIVARDPTATLVIVEVRSRSGSGLGTPEETVDGGKVARLYAAAWQLARGSHPTQDAAVTKGTYRVDLVSVVRGNDGIWRLRGHIRGLAPP
jgi:putative endonuclease